MSIIRSSHNKENPYVILNKKILEITELSWEAKGLWSYLLSRPDNWSVSVAHLSKTFPAGRDKIRSLLRQLNNYGLCDKIITRFKGKFSSIEYTVYEECKEITPWTENTSPVPATEKTAPVKPTLINKDNNKKGINIEIPKGISSCSDKSEPEKTKKNIFFDRQTRKFKNITNDKLYKLRKAYPGVNIDTELEQMKLWLEETPQGKNRKGAWKFIYSWIRKSFDKKEYNSNKSVCKSIDINNCSHDFMDFLTRAQQKFRGSKASNVTFSIFRDKGYALVGFKDDVEKIKYNSNTFNENSAKEMIVSFLRKINVI